MENPNVLKLEKLFNRLRFVRGYGLLVLDDG